TYETLQIGSPVMWMGADNATITVEAQPVNDRGGKVRKLYRAGLQTMLSLPQPGCWRLDAQTGVEHGSITLWVIK
ncbi:MAG: hypothetical protein ACREP1_05785, partial [Rhodanobacteraceae bacterium]